MSGTDYTGKPATQPAHKSSQAKTPAWPTAASATVALGHAAESDLAPHVNVSRPAHTPAFTATKVANQPVTLAPSRSHPDQTPGQFKVSTLSHAQSSAVGVNGVVVSVARADGQTGSAPIDVQLSYSAFADAYGGGYASRLHLVRLPACALTTPNVPTCRTQTPVAGSVDAESQTLDASVTLPASSPSPAASVETRAVSVPSTSTGMILLGLTPSPSGPDGNYTAAAQTNPAGQWSGGNASGAFNYSIPISVPPALGGTAPSLGIAYDSQAVDGKTSMQNGQASWIGDGWNLDVGSIS